MSQLPQNEVIEDAIRKKAKLVPEIVIRELVANALIHQEFTEKGTSVMIEIYDNRIEISNPGKPIVPLERFIDGYQSRNERLADLMRRFGICEEKGSGIDKVVIAAEAFQLPAPAFPKLENRTSVVIFGPREFAGMDRDDRTRACFQHCALKWVMQERMRARVGGGRGLPNCLRCHFLVAQHAPTDQGTSSIVGVPRKKGAPSDRHDGLPSSNTEWIPRNKGFGLSASSEDLIGLIDGLRFMIDEV